MTGVRANKRSPRNGNPEKEQRSSTKNLIPTNGRKRTRTKGTAMGLASYEIIGNAGEWRITQDGKAENIYGTKEFAFEAAVAAASLALRQGHEIRITAPASQTATGAANAG
jgi:hypothetical protein